MDAPEVTDGEVQTAPTVPYLVFRVRARWLALPIGSVHTFLSEVDLYPVPGSPPFILGVIHALGTIVNVVDTGSMLGIEGQARRIQELGTRYVILRNAGTAMALTVDENAGIVDALETDVAKGAFVHGDATVEVADISKLVASAELALRNWEEGRRSF